MQEIAWIIGLTSATSSTTLAHVVQYTATPGHAVWVYCQHILRPIYGDTTSEPTTACHAPPRHSICMISPLPRAPPVTCEAKELTPLLHPDGAGAEKIVWVRRHLHHSDFILFVTDAQRDVSGAPSAAASCTWTSLSGSWRVHP